MSVFHRKTLGELEAAREAKIAQKNRIERREMPRLFPTVREGLTSAQAAQLKDAGWYNAPIESPSKSIPEIIRTNVFTYFNMIFVIFAVLLISVGSFRDLTFVPVILSNTLIGIIQEIRAKKTLDKLTMLHAPRSLVVRDGKEIQISSEELVRDDILILQAGDQIPADAVVAEGDASVNESLLTGEPDEVHKGVEDDLLSGSFLVSGRCYARVENVGADSYISHLTLKAKATRTGEQSEMIRSLNLLLKIIGIVILPIAGLMFYQSYIAGGETLKDSFRGMIAACIGMIPEGLFLLASVTLAISTVRLAGKKVLVHEMKCIETLARVDVLCVDKTGTITSGEMRVEELVPVTRPAQMPSEAAEVMHPAEAEFAAVIDVAETAAGPESAAEEALEEAAEKSAAAAVEVLEAEAEKAEGEILDMPSVEELPGLLGDFAAAQSSDNITMAALKAYFTHPAGREALFVSGFSSRYKYSAVRFAEGTYVLGAPEFLLKDQTELYRETIEAYASKGCRVLVFGKTGEAAEGGELTQAVEPAGFVVLSNPIRESAPETFRYFAEQGVEIKVISGDNPVTVAEVARQAGIAGAEKYIDASTLTSQKALEEAIVSYTVFGRVTPEQKRKFVKALQKAGRTVAMTGDGVNDVLALKDADCSVAMASGSSAAVQASKLVLLDSDFSHMPDVVTEGRQVVNNLQRSGSLFLVKNIFSLILAVLSLVFMISYPLTPNQVSLISTFTIGMPAFLLSQMPDRDLIRGSFLGNILIKAFPGGLTDVITVAAMVWFGHVLEVTGEEIGTAAVVLLAIVGLMVLYSISKPMNKYKWGILGLSAAGLLTGFFVLSDLFGIAGMSTKAVLLCVNFGIMTEPFMRYLTKLAQWIGGHFQRGKERIGKQRL